MIFPVKYKMKPPLSQRLVLGHAINWGLLAYWPIRERAGVTIFDASGGRNPGTLLNNATFGYGRFGRALEFEGTAGSHVTIADKPEWDFPSDFTIALWVRFHSIGDNWWETAFMGHDEGGGGVPKWIFSYDAPGDKTIFHYNGPVRGGQVIVGNTWVPTVGQWYFICLTREGSTFIFYRDGIFDGSQVNANAIEPAATPLTIGWAEGASIFDGLIDNIMIFSRPLVACEIVLLYIHSLRALSATRGRPELATLPGPGNPYYYQQLVQRRIA